MHIRILVDWKYDGKMSVEDALKSHGMNYNIYDIPDYSMKDRTHKHRIILLYMKYLKQACKVVSIASEKDLLICFNFTTSIAVGLVSKFKRKRCAILGINIIAPKRKGIVEKLRNMLFHHIMKSDNFFVTVNSKDYISDYSKRFNINQEKFFVLHDSIMNTDDSLPFLYRKSYVFCGGEAKRDWSTMLKACQAIPEIQFLFVARKKYFDKSLVIPPNATIIFDVSEDEFYNYLKESSLVSIPLETRLPAGLIVILKCALYHKPLIVTRTPSVENYIEHNESGYLIEIKDHNDLSSKIEMLYHNPELQKLFSENLYEKVIKYHSPENRALKLIWIINQISGLQNENQAGSNLGESIYGR